MASSSIGCPHFLSTIISYFHIFLLVLRLEKRDPRVSMFAGCVPCPSRRLRPAANDGALRAAPLGGERVCFSFACARIFVLRVCIASVIFLKPGESEVK